MNNIVPGSPDCIVRFDPNLALTDSTYVSKWVRQETLARKHAAKKLRTQKPVDVCVRENSFGPSDWKDFVGQDLLKTRLMVLMNGAKSRSEPLQPVLLLAVPGAGKTTVAELMAKFMGVDIVSVTRPIEPDRLLRLLMDAEPDAMLFVDECHQQSSKTQHFLMQLTEDRRVDVPWGFERFDRLNIVLATTEKEKVNDALRSRFQIVEWDDYSDDEMGRIVQRMGERVNIRICDVDALILGHAAVGSPRRARKFVSDARDMSDAGFPVDGESVLGFSGVTRDGLGRDHVQYLVALREMRGQSGLDALCTRLRMNSSAVKDVERVLVERGMVTFSPKGRVLTNAGRDACVGKGA